MKDVTCFVEETEEEIQEREEAQRAEEEAKAKAPPAKGAVPNSSMSTNGGANANKFTPDCISISTGALNSMSDLMGFADYEGKLPLEGHFAYIIDDKSFEDDCSISTNSSSVDLSVGLNCEYLLLKGIRKSERYSKLTHYMANFM